MANKSTNEKRSEDDNLVVRHQSPILIYENQAGGITIESDDPGQMESVYISFSKHQAKSICQKIFELADNE